jgi:tRNA threonylcarbamoyladenosine biosynthesis protein TsaB
MKAGNVLVIETSTPRGSIALVSREAEVLFSDSFESRRSHNALLFEPLLRALDCGHAFGAILVGIGPGSYTGVRIGISAALGVSLARDVPVAGVCSLCALGAAPASGNYRVVGDARRGGFYFAEIRQWRVSSGPSVCSGAELESLVHGDALPVLTCDTSPLPVEARVTHPDAALLALAARHQSPDFSSTVEPIYLRAPYITMPKPKGRPKG